MEPMPKTQPARSVEAFKDHIAEGLWSLIEPVEILDEWEANYNLGDVEAVKASYQEFGQRKPIVARRTADGRGEVTAGNTQLRAARDMGWEHIAVVWVNDDDAKAIAWALADNHTAEKSKTDEEKLLDALMMVRTNPLLLQATSYTDEDMRILAASTGRTAEAEAAFLAGLTDPSMGSGAPKGDTLAVGEGAQLIFTFGSREIRERVTELLRGYMIKTSCQTLAESLLHLLEATDNAQ